MSSLVAGVKVEIHDRGFGYKNPTVERRRGRRSGIDFFRHLAKTTHWNAEEKNTTLVNKEIRMRLDLRHFVLWVGLVFFLLVYLLSLSWGS